ncbi:MAG: hypothetical protein AB2L24_21720 [Mangrovibacterium sp.]
MYCEITHNGKFALQDLSLRDLEVIQEGLIVLKDSRVIQSKDFEEERQVMTEIYQSIDNELVKTRIGLAPVQVKS